MQAISDNLIHFLDKQNKGSPNRQLEVFKSIIKDGLKFGKIEISFGDRRCLYNYCICFTDIPLILSREHADHYGSFGIGFKKSSIKKCGGNPARYFTNYLAGEDPNQPSIDKRGRLYEDLHSHFKLVLDLNDELAKDKNFALHDQNGTRKFSHEEIGKWISLQLTILSFEKETGDLGPARDEATDTDLFYREREWRLVPFDANLASGAVVKVKDKDSYFYKFKRQDVNMIVTPNDDVRIEVLNFLLGLKTMKENRLREFAKNPLPIITYDDLNRW